MIKLVLAFLLLTCGANALPLKGLTDFSGKEPSKIHDKDKELVVFWATWCSDCKTHFRSDLPNLAKRPDVAVVTINLDSDMERAKNFVEKEKIELPVLMDSKKILQTQLNVIAVPFWAVYHKTKGEWKLIDAKPAFNMTEIEAALAKK